MHISLLLFSLIAVAALSLPTSAEGGAPGKVIAYPAPPGLTASPDFTAEADGTPVWTEGLEVATPPEMPAYLRNSPHVGAVQRVAIANFGATGALTVTITAKEPVRSCVVRPKSLGIVPKVEGNRVTLALAGPAKLWVEMDKRPPLLIFANPPEADVPGQNDAHVKYYGPGEHVLGPIHPADGDIIYLAPGAIVYGAIQANGCSHVRVLGRGILDSSREPQGTVVLLEHTNDVTIEGIMVRATRRGWTCIPRNSKGVTFHDVKVLSFGQNGDGIDPTSSSDVTIDHCFLRCVDDCIAVKNLAPGEAMENITVSNTTMFGFAVSDGFTIGFEEKGPVRNVKVVNCDVLGARGGGATGGHSALSIVCDGPGPVSDVLFEDIRVEDQVEMKNFELIVTDGQRYVKMPPGSISNVTVRNVHWEQADRPLVLKGFDADHTLSGVTFENCTVGGKPLTGPGDAHFQTNEFVKELKFVAR